MEIKNLITFTTVAELNSFTKAAQNLNYSQSTVSFQIKQLEMELGCLLFERINHTISLTDKGKELLVFARKIRQETESFNENLLNKHELSGTLNIVVPDSLCEEMLNKNYLDLYKKYPQISLDFKTADTVQMFELLEQNEADVILTLDKHVYSNNYVIAKEEPIKMNLVTGVNSIYATKKRLSFSDIVNFKFILTEKNMGYRKIIDEEFAKRSLDVTPILTIGRTDVILNILENNVGVSFLPEFVTRKKVEEGKLMYLNVEDFQPRIWKQLIYHKNKWMSKSLNALIEYIKEHEFSNGN